MNSKNVSSSSQALPENLTRVFVTPALGWRHDDTRLPSHLDNRGAGSMDGVATQIHTDPVRKTYVPYPIAVIRYLERQGVSYDDFVRRGRLDHRFRPRDKQRGGRFVIRLRDDLQDVPDGAYDVSLTVGGKRSYLVSAPRKTRGDLAQALRGWRDAYAVWSRLDGSDIPVAVTLPDGRTIHATKSGRGVFYARQEQYLPGHGFIGHYEQFVLVTFRFKEGRLRHKDAVHLDIECWSPLRESPSKSVSAEDFRGYDDTLGENWLPMMNRALQGFDEHCLEMPAESRAILNELAVKKQCF